MFGWLEELAEAVEARHGKEVRDKIFGDISGLTPDHEILAEWFGKFNLALDELDDKEFLTTAIAGLCPCRSPEIEENIRKIMKRARICVSLLIG